MSWKPKKGRKLTLKLSGFYKTKFRFGFRISLFHNQFNWFSLAIFFSLWLFLDCCCCCCYCDISILLLLNWVMDSISRISFLLVFCEKRKKIIKIFSIEMKYRSSLHWQKKTKFWLIRLNFCFCLGFWEKFLNFFREIFPSMMITFIIQFIRLYRSEFLCFLWRLLLRYIYFVTDCQSQTHTHINQPNRTKTKNRKKSIMIRFFCCLFHTHTKKDLPEQKIPACLPFFSLKKHTLNFFFSLLQTIIIIIIMMDICCTARNKRKEKTEWNFIQYPILLFSFFRYRYK